MTNEQLIGLLRTVANRVKVIDKIALDANRRQLNLERAFLQCLREAPTATAKGMIDTLARSESTLEILEAENETFWREFEESLKRQTQDPELPTSQN